MKYYNENHIHIKNIDQLEQLRQIKVYGNLIIYIDEDLDFSSVKSFKPICLKGTNLLIIGNNKTIKNLNIDNNEVEKTGLFSEMENLIIRDLNIENFNIKGGVYTGSICGYVSDIFEISSSNVLANVSAEAYCGGLVGICNIANIKENCNIETNVDGIDVVGGIVGLTSSIYKDNTTLCKANVSSIGKCNGKYYGYCSKAQESTIIDMLKQCPSERPNILGKKKKGLMFF